MSLPTKANVSRPSAYGYDALVEYGPDPEDSLYLRLAVGPGRELTVQTAPLEPPRISTDENPEDMRPESGQVFSRSDWSGGQGLDRAHRRNAEDTDFTRYWDSRGVDISLTQKGEPSRLRLLRRTREVVPEADVQAIAQVDDVVYFTDGDRVGRIVNVTSSSPTVTFQPPVTGADVLDLAALGGAVYAAIDEAGIYRRSVAGSWSSWSDVEAVRVWGLKGRIIAATADGGLYEADAADGSVLLHTLPEGRQWTDATDAGEVILVSADDGHVYAFTDDEGDLVLAGQTRLPAEQPTALAEGFGVVLVGTSQPTTAGGRIGRLWRFAVQGGQLAAGQLLREWGDGDTAVDRSPTAMLVARDVVHVGVSDGATAESWQYHLQTGGLSRGLEGGPGQIAGFAVVDGRAVAGIRGQAVWVESDEYVDEGWLISPAADFYSSVPKQWVGARLHTPTVLSGEVLLSYSTDIDALSDPDHPSWRVAVKATPSSPGIGEEALLRNVTGRYLIFKLTLRATSPASSPEVESVAFRAFPDPHEVIMQVPINVSDRLELPGRRPITIKGVGDQVWQALKEIEGQDVILTVFRPDDRLYGQVMQVTTPVVELARRGSTTSYCQLTIRGRRTLPTVPISGPTFGVPMFGEPLFGGAHAKGVA